MQLVLLEQTMTDYAELQLLVAAWRTGFWCASCKELVPKLDAALRRVIAERDVERAKVSGLEAERVTVAEALAESATYEEQLSAEREKVARLQNTIERLTGGRLKKPKTP